MGICKKHGCETETRIEMTYDHEGNETGKGWAGEWCPECEADAHKEAHQALFGIVAGLTDTEEWQD